MPAKSPYIISDGEEEVLKIEVVEDGLDGRRSVYFMDQSPAFTIKVENIGDQPTEGHTYARMVFDESQNDYELNTHEKLDCSLGICASREIEYNLDMLSYQGNAAIRIDKTHAKTKEEVVDISKTATTRPRRIYTCMVYDRDYYRVNYLRPRRAQYLASLLAVLIVMTGVGQLLSSAGYI